MSEPNVHRPKFSVAQRNTKPATATGSVSGTTTNSSTAAPNTPAAPTENAASHPTTATHDTEAVTHSKVSQTPSSTGPDTSATMPTAASLNAAAPTSSSATPAAPTAATPSTGTNTGAAATETTSQVTNAGTITSNGFDWALQQLKAGQCVARSGWDGKGMFIYLVPGSNFKVSRAPLLGIFEEGTEIEYLSHIDMRTAQGSCVPWLASQSDLLSSDWVLA